MNLRIAHLTWTVMLTGVFFLSASTMASAIGIGDLVDGAKKAGGSISDYTKNAGGKISDYSKQTGGKVSDSAKKIGGDASKYTKQAGPKISNYAEEKVGRHLPHWVHRKEVEIPMPKNDQSSSKTGESPNSKKENTVTNPPVDVNRSQGLTRYRPFVEKRSTGSFTRPELMNKSNSRLDHGSRRVSSKSDYLRPYNLSRPTKVNGQVDRHYVGGKRSGRDGGLKQYGNGLELYPGTGILKGNLGNIVLSSGNSTLPVIPQSEFGLTAPYGSVSMQLAGDQLPQYDTPLPAQVQWPPVPQPVDVPANVAYPLVIDNNTDQVVMCQFRDTMGQVNTLSLEPGETQTFDADDNLRIRFQSGNGLKVYTLLAGSHSVFYELQDGSIELGDQSDR